MSQPVLQVVSHSQEQTEGFAARLATTFGPGDVLILVGPLGAGKTAFVRGLASGMNLNADSVNSPSYTFINEYRGATPLYHFDLYRMRNTTELTEIGWDDYLGRNGVVVVEWGERAQNLLPARYYRLTFNILTETEREIEVSLIE
jgi:tRNA threonylcarbamoyladenosine biosynthesis protein TsaE